MLFALFRPYFLSSYDLFIATQETDITLLSLIPNLLIGSFSVSHSLYYFFFLPYSLIFLETKLYTIPPCHISFCIGNILLNTSWCIGLFNSLALCLNPMFPQKWLSDCPNRSDNLLLLPSRLVSQCWPSSPWSVVMFTGCSSEQWRNGFEVLTIYVITH